MTIVVWTLLIYVYMVNTFTVFNFHSILTCIKHFSMHPVSQPPVNVSVCVCAGHPDHPSLHQDLQLEQWEHLLPHHHRQPGQRKQTAVWDLTGGWQQHTQLSKIKEVLRITTEILMIATPQAAWTNAWVKTTEYMLSTTMAHMIHKYV